MNSTRSPRRNVLHAVALTLLVGCVALINAGPLAVQSTRTRHAAEAPAFALTSQLFDELDATTTTETTMPSKPPQDADIADDDDDDDVDNSSESIMPANLVHSPCEAKCIAALQRDAVDDVDSAPVKMMDCPTNERCQQCWLQCARVPSSAAPPFRIVSMVKQEFLVATRVAWPAPVSQRDSCYVTWEVAGGGLVGHMLADGGAAELSLWPDTKYRVVVVCKLKATGKLVRSKTLFVNTSHAMSMKPDPPSSSEQAADNSLLPNYILDNRILKGSESSGSSSNPNRNRVAESHTFSPAAASTPNDGPHIERMSRLEAISRPQRIVGFVLLAIVVLIFIDFMLRGPGLRAVLRACGYVPGGYDCSADQLAKLAAMPPMTETTTPSHLQYVKYAEASASAAVTGTR